MARASRDSSDDLVARAVAMEQEVRDLIMRALACTGFIAGGGCGGQQLRTLLSKSILCVLLFGLSDAL